MTRSAIPCDLLDDPWITDQHHPGRSSWIDSMGQADL
jgi:hypothetical protein